MTPIRPVSAQEAKFIRDRWLYFTAGGYIGIITTISILCLFGVLR